MSSCFLFFGPGARSAALKEASRVGRLVAPPFGDAGLKVDEAREVVELLLSTPVGTGTGVVIVGPLDEAPAKSTDALLKTLEEFNDQATRPILWAHDLGGVSSTIRSRCLSKWADAKDVTEEDEKILMAASSALDASMKGDRNGIAEALKDLPMGNDGVSLMKRRSFLGLVAGQLALDIENPQARSLWERLRGVTRWRNPTVIEILSVLLPEKRV